MPRIESAASAIYSCEKIGCAWENVFIGAFGSVPNSEASIRCAWRYSLMLHGLRGKNIAAIFAGLLIKPP